MKDVIKKLIGKAIEELRSQENWGDFDAPEIEVDYPKSETFGDFTTNAAMNLSRILKKNPLEIAKEIKDQIMKAGNENFEKIEVVKPGYINFYLSKEFLRGVINEINEKGDKFGDSVVGKNKKVQVEFISSNPTGPIHLGNGRGGPIGDALANILDKSGYAVEREFYVNDFGNQVNVLGHSVLQDEEAQYSGDYIAGLTKDKPKELIDSMEVGIWAANVILQKYIRPTCEKLGIFFDTWFSEKSLHTSGEVDAVIEVLKEKKLTYEKDGALWFKSMEFGDDKDRVIVKSDSKKTYSVNDFAYHKNKVERGFSKLINIQGSDHHKEAEVVKKFVEEILGYKDKVDYILSQFVRVMKDGKEVKMSKRKGVYFALDDLIEEVGRDAVRFIFTSYAPTSHINFDINLAKERSEKNPVYYVQYAHARIGSILRKAEEAKMKNENLKLELLVHEKELSLIRELNKFPELIEEIARSYEVHKLPYYAIKISDKFHSFYNDCLVLDEKNPKLSAARLELVKSVKIVLAETLRLIGVTAPEKM